MRTNWAIAILTVSCGLAYWPAEAAACTCMVSPLNCAGIRESDAVFEATVESIQLGAVSERGSFTAGAASATMFSNDVHVVTLRDVNALRAEPQATVTTAADGSSCGYEFQAGSRYLIVATRSADGRLWVSRCGLTRLLASAGGLVEYLRTLEDTPRQARVWGTVSMPTRWIGFMRESEPIAAAQVTLSGPERRSVTTTADGRYTVAGLPFGRYTVSVTLPGTFPQLDQIESRSVELDAANSCAELGFTAPIKSAISGVVTDETGSPLEGVFVSLGLPDQLDRSRGDVAAGFTTDASGRYEFKNLPPGRYVVGLNISGRGPNPGAPFAVAYARTTAGDTVVSLPSGGTTVLAPLPARRLTQITVSGIARTAAGSPARGVALSPALFGEQGQMYDEPSVTTDGEGRFRLRLWRGERYRITAGSRFRPDAELEFVATDQPLVVTVVAR